MDRRALAVALLVALAGCNAFGGGSGDATPTVTPAPVPDPTPTERPGAAAVPGLSEAGVVDVDALAAAHRAALANRTYVRTVERRNGNRTMRSTLRVADQRTYAYEASAPSLVANTSAYADGETLYTRHSRRDQVYPRYERTGTVAPAVERYAGAMLGPVRRYFPARDAQVAAISVRNRRHYEVIGHTPPAGAAPGVENYTVRAVIERTGLVRSLFVSYDLVRDGRSRSVLVRIHYVFRPVTIERPAWVTRRWPTTPG
ncbi:MAG: hypothetical protein ABEJ89_07465 [Haloarculaceae archaeon]